MSHDLAEMFAPTADQETDLQSHAAALLAARASKEQLQAETRAASQAEETAERTFIAAMQAAGLHGLKLKSGESMNLSSRTHFKAPSRADEARRNDAIAWLQSVGLGDLVRLDVNAQSLGASLREHEQNGGEVPEQLFDRYVETTVSVRKGRA